MKYNVNDQLHGFIVKRVRHVNELQGDFYEMEHLKTKAQLIWLDNKENNKFFCIGFKTIPTDNTGVFHILEHSVLNGSKKYTTKEPFVELLKGSLKTFLNAMTYPDKTIYPVSSCNEKDFQNLMKVYLDSVFAPAIYNNPNIFYQEGCHYELRDENADLEYKGVVLNEMKGVFSSSQEVVLKKLQEMIFPDNTYRYVAGGDPEDITDLTYEQFLNSHGEFYHPSNSKIFLEGDMNLDATLAIIDGEYLSKYECRLVEFDFPVQEAVENVEDDVEYEIPQDEDESNKTQVAFGKIVCSYDDYKRVLATKILCQYMAGSNDAPFKRELLQSGLAQDIRLMVFDGIKQPYLYGHIYNMRAEDKTAVLGLLKKALENIMMVGLDQSELEAIINQYEFLLKEGKEPKGLMHVTSAYEAWLYNGDPLQNMVCGEAFAKLRKSLKDGYFEDLFKEIFCDWDQMAVLTAHPSKEIGQKKAEREKKKLYDIKRTWTKQETEAILEINRKLDEWQQKVDSKEDLNTLPKLSLADVSREPEPRSTVENIENGVKVLFHKAKTNGIVYLNMYFDIGNPDEALWPALGFLPNLLTNLPTEKYSVAELKRTIRRDIGALDFNVEAVSKMNEPNQCKMYLEVSASVLEENLSIALDLIVEILRHTKLEDTDRIAVLWTQTEQYFLQDIIMQGHLYSMRRAEANNCAESYVNEGLIGISCYKWLKSQLKDACNNARVYVEKVLPILQDTLCKERMLIGLTADDYMGLDAFVSRFEAGRKVDFQIVHDRHLENNSQVLQIPAGISYATKSYNIALANVAQSGVFHVLSKVVGLNYLWNEVRVKGGAYGSGLRYTKAGNLSFFSYRDPDSIRSSEVYKNTSEYIRTFCKSDDELEKLIIGTVADFESLKSNKDWGKVCDMDFLRGVGAEDRIKEKQEILDCNKEKLLACADVLDIIDEKGSSYIMGYESIVNKCVEQGYIVEKLVVEE